MSATLGAVIQQLEPEWSITILEKLGDVALESSNAWNNAGTGHSALCELNYTPEREDGTIDISQAVKVNEQFQVTRQFWSFLVSKGLLPEPDKFINSVPHMSFVWGEDNVDYLRKRYEALKDHPLFPGLEYSEDARVIRSWAPLLIPGRKRTQAIAATRIVGGTDVDFGSLTHSLLDGLVAHGAELKLEHRVTGLKRKDGAWRITGRRDVGNTPFELTARFVFVGAGGAALNLLQRSGIPEIRGYGGFPISGQFLRTDDPAVVAQHSAKVYGKAAVGSPPMSVPHLDTRVVDGHAEPPVRAVRGLHAQVPQARLLVRPVRLDPLPQPRHDGRGRDQEPLAGLVPGHRAARDARQEAPRARPVRAEREARRLAHDHRGTARADHEEGRGRQGDHPVRHRGRRRSRRVDRRPARGVARGIDGGSDHARCAHAAASRTGSRAGRRASAR